MSRQTRSPSQLHPPSFQTKSAGMVISTNITHILRTGKREAIDVITTPMDKGTNIIARSMENNTVLVLVVAQDRRTDSSRKNLGRVNITS